jgi:hypothetical protein
MLFWFCFTVCLSAYKSAKSSVVSSAASRLRRRVPRLVHNVCVSAVVPFRSRVLSHETKTLNEDRTFYQLVTAPLQKHTVSACALLPVLVSQSSTVLFVPMSTELFCETQVARGQPSHQFFSLHESLTALSPWCGGGTLAKALDVCWVWAALACVPLVGLNFLCIFNNSLLLLWWL